MREKTKCTRWFRYTIEDAKAAQAELDQWEIGRASCRERV